MDSASLPLERFIPDPEVKERFETTIRAPAHLVMEIAVHFDMQSVKLVKVIFWLRERLVRASPSRTSKVAVHSRGNEIIGMGSFSRAAREACGLRGDLPAVARQCEILGVSSRRIRDICRTGPSKDRLDPRNRGDGLGDNAVCSRRVRSQPTGTPVSNFDAIGDGRASASSQFASS
jgi:hypothetical protein